MAESARPESKLQYPYGQVTEMRNLGEQRRVKAQANSIRVFTD